MQLHLYNNFWTKGIRKNVSKECNDVQLKLGRFKNKILIEKKL